ncbi:MAG: hypothetical protein Q7R96_01715 [Nanoarchaeota archaeon]|nr:hypothetical protein [Nanoarchaeota archaeon]
MFYKVLKNATIEDGTLTVSYSFKQITTQEEYNSHREMYRRRVADREGREVSLAEVDVDPKPGQSVEVINIIRYRTDREINLLALTMSDPNRRQNLLLLRLDLKNWLSEQDTPSFMTRRLVHGLTALL